MTREPSWIKAGSQAVGGCPCREHSRQRWRGSAPSDTMPPTSPCPIPVLVTLWVQQLLTALAGCALLVVTRPAGPGEVGTSQRTWRQPKRPTMANKQACPSDQVIETRGDMETRAVVPMSQRQWHGPLVLTSGLGALAGISPEAPAPALHQVCPRPLQCTRLRRPARAGAHVPLRGRWYLQAAKLQEAGKDGLFCQGSFQVQCGLRIPDQDPLVDSRVSDYRTRHLLTQLLNLPARPPAQRQDGAQTPWPACLPGPKGTQGCVTDGSPLGWFSRQAPTHGKPKLCHPGKILPWAGCPRLLAGPLLGLTGGGQRMPGQACFSEWFTANAFLGHQGPLLCGHSSDGAEVVRGAQ